MIDAPTGHCAGRGGLDVDGGSIYMLKENATDLQSVPFHFGIVMVRTIWVSVSRRSETALMPERWIF